MLEWKRLSPAPFLYRLGEAITTPDVVLWRDELILYVGAIQGEHEHIITLPFSLALQDAPVSPNARVAIDIDPHGFDSQHVFDPAAVAANGQVFLYYSAIGTGQDCIGLAVSDDGRIFHKEARAILAGRAPEVVRWDERFYLFYVRPEPPYAIFLAVSEDGRQFRPASDVPVLEADRGWDSFEVTTPRLFRRREMFYMLYAGSGDAARRDKPDAFGLSRSSDLRHWERYPANPVFHTGEPGMWDDGAIWFGTVFEWQDRLYLLYEGGALETIDQTPALTQVGLAALETSVFDRLVAGWQ